MKPIFISYFLFSLVILNLVPLHADEQEGSIKEAAVLRILFPQKQAPKEPKVLERRAWGKNQLLVLVESKAIESIKPANSKERPYQFQTTVFELGILDVTKKLPSLVAKTEIARLFDFSGIEVFPNPKPVRLDLASYDIRSGQRAIGLRVINAGFGQKEGTGTEFLQIYEFRDQKLSEVLKAAAIDMSYVAPSTDRTSYTFHISKTKLDGYFEVERRKIQSKSSGPDARPNKSIFKWSAQESLYLPVDEKFER